MKFNVNVNIKRKFKINGKEYNSIEEMPDDVRETFRKMMDSMAGAGRQAGLTGKRTRIIFNGTEYESVEAMPQDVRRQYEEVLRTVEADPASPEIHGAELESGRERELGILGPAHLDNAPPSSQFEPPVSARTLIVSAMLLALVLLLYYLWRIK